MSGIIAGYLNASLNKDKANIINEKIQNIFNTYKIDAFNKILTENVSLFCGLFNIRNIDKREKLPSYKSDNRYIITGDIILDNREELFEEFKINDEIKMFITDSDLAAKCYERWGDDCARHLTGDFAFAVYDIEEKKLACFTDHLYTRPLYYWTDGENFAFSSIENALLYFSDMEINEKWLTDWLAIRGPVGNIEAGTTIYSDIHLMPPAAVLTVQGGEINLRKYWEPLKEVKPLKGKTEEEYIEEFLKIFKEAVRCRLDTTGDVGITVSGGLDSGSVACIAAPELKRQHKNLYGYTFVPLEGYAREYEGRRCVDESDYVKILMKQHKNLEVKFCRNEGRNSMTDMEEYVKIFEMPVKSIENSYWITQAVKECSEKNIKIILDGQFGNTSVSYGEFFCNAHELLTHGKILKLKEEIDGAKQMYNAPRKKVCKIILKNMIPNSFHKTRHKKDITTEERFENTPVNLNLIKKWDVERRFNEEKVMMWYPFFLTFNEERRFSLKDAALTGISIMKAKDSMKYGVIVRDPTKDKRVVEYCLSLPSEMFVHKGEQRYLIRRAMKGILPEEIRTNWKHRGLQSADWIDRLKPEWGKYVKDIEEALNDSQLQKYVDIEKMKKYISENREITDDTNSMTIRCLLEVLILEMFLKEHRKNFAEKSESFKNFN